MPQLLSHAFRSTVQKDNENRGRQFYACSKPQHEKYRFFKWVDEFNPDGDGRLTAECWGSTSGGIGAGRMLFVLSRYCRSIIIKIGILYFVRNHTHITDE